MVYQIHTETSSLRNFENMPRNLNEIVRSLIRLLYRNFAAQNPMLPPLHTVYVYTVYLFTQERGEGLRVEPERRLEGQQFTKLGRIYQHD
jgi:hypothetical protein